jgi:NADH dehydrogenase
VAGSERRRPRDAARSKQAAQQAGTNLGHIAYGDERGRPSPRRFRYIDLGTMATIARFRAVVSVGRIRVAGFAGWLMWLVVHLAFMTGFKNRVAAVANWAAAFLGRGCRQRVITEQTVRAPTTEADRTQASRGAESRG